MRNKHQHLNVSHISGITLSWSCVYVEFPPSYRCWWCSSIYLFICLFLKYEPELFYVVIATQQRTGTLWVENDPQNSDTNYESLHNSQEYESVLRACTMPARGGRKKKSLPLPPARAIFCIIGEHIVNMIITHLQMNSNFTSCQKESNELLHEDFTESKSPDILIGVWSQLYTSPCVFLPFTRFHFIHLHRASFQVGTKKKRKGKEFLCWKYLRFVFKFSWNLWEHWGAISHLHWHLISQVKSENTNCQGFPVCPIILHQFPWPYGTLVN